MCMSYFLTFAITLYHASLFTVCPKASDIITLNSTFSPHYSLWLFLHESLPYPMTPSLHSVICLSNSGSLSQLSTS